MKKSIMFLLVALFAGCSPYHVKTDYNPEVDFSAYKSFNWIKPKPNSRKSKPYQTLHEQRIKAAIAKEFTTKGYKFADTDKPDLLLAFHIATLNKLDVTHFGYRPGRWGYRGPGYTTVHKYKEGTFILDIVDPVEKVMIWRGAVSGIVLNQNSDDNDIAEIVKKLLEKYPPDLE